MYLIQDNKRGMIELTARMSTCGEIIVLCNEKQPPPVTHITYFIEEKTEPPVTEMNLNGEDLQNQKALPFYALSPSPDI